MGEEAMWKHFYEKIERQESKEDSEHNSQVQELDGGFFERFGTLLKEQAADNQKEVQEDSKQEDERNEGENGTQEEPVEEEVPDQGEIINNAVGWNIEELYSEILYEILHIIGSDSTALEEEQQMLLNYLQEVFKIEQEKHESILETIKSKEAPNMLINVEVVESKELRPMDANGLSDPFCTLYLSSDPKHRYNTSVKKKTLSPKWEEHFSLPVKNMAEDILCIEVWDFDPAETVKEKMSKIGEVKGVKGFSRLMKEIAVTASTGKHDNEFIGTAVIPLKVIPATGQTMWCNLEKKTKVKRQGIIKLNLAFSSEKNSQVAGQEHRHLLRILLLHELEINKTEAYQWNGQFSEAADTILRQHLAQSGLSATDDVLAQWVEFASVHTSHPLNFQIFANLVKKLVHPINNGLLSDVEIRLFWDAAKKLLPSCFNSIKKIRKLTPGEKSTVLHIQSLLTILSELSKVQQTENLDLFPPSVYGWISNKDDCPNSNILDALHDAVTQSATDWFQHIVEHNKPADNTDEAQLKHQIKVIQLIRTDLQRAIEFHDKLFSQIVLMPYSKTLYIIYEAKISEMSEPTVKDLCMSMKPIRFNEDQEILNDDSSNLLTMGTTLFELYLVLQRFMVLGTGICSTDMDGLQIKQFHTWFHRGVAHWLDIAVYKATQRISKAVELDKLTPVDASVKYSSSAVDTLSIFFQIKLFWQQLAWPDIEGSYTFVAKIMDDICRCCVYYADIMSKNVEKLGETETVYEKKFEVTSEWCLAINNIDYVRQSIHPFLSELGMEDIVKSLAEFKSPSAAEHCRQTLQLVIDNAIDTVKNKILDLLEVVAKKMQPSITRFLMEGAELLNQESNSVDRLMQYLEDNLVTLSSQLNPDNFDRILNIIFEKTSYIVYDLMESSLEKRRPPSYFSNLHVMLKTLIGFFKQGDGADKTLNTNNNNEILEKIETVLSLHGMETWQLIHQYHVERLNQQQNMTIPTHGMITVRMQFVHDLLRIEIMNARNLHPMDDNGLCDPYVKIHLVPEEKFMNVAKLKTKTHKKTLFPLYDEHFAIQLTREQREIKDAMVHFLIRDQDFLGMSSDFVAEAYFPFSGIPATTMETRIEEITQIHLKLSKPTKLDTPAMKALEHRQGEKLAKDFIKKQKAKINDKLTNGNSH